MHALLLLVVLFGAAFLAPEKPKPIETLTMVPSMLLDNVLAGGGGNPNIARTEAKISGSTLDPVPPRPQPVKPEVAKVAPAPPKNTIPKQAPIELKSLKKPADRTKPKTDQAKARAAEKAAQEKLAKALGKVRENMRQGFTSGTAVEVSGPGGAAYASYRSFVFAAYDNAWQVNPDVSNDDSVVIARVVVHRTGRIISADITQRSGLPAVDKSVQRALEAVTSLPPFPPGASDQERTFVIEFSLKAKRLIG